MGKKICHVLLVCKKYHCFKLFLVNYPNKISAKYPVINFCKYIWESETAKYDSSTEKNPLIFAL